MDRTYMIWLCPAFELGSRRNPEFTPGARLQITPQESEDDNNLVIIIITVVAVVVVLVLAGIGWFQYMKVVVILVESG